MEARPHFDGPPVGWREDITWPRWVSATHCDPDGHAMSRRDSSPVCTPLTSFHARAPPVGLVLVITAPPSVTPAQNRSVAHEIALIASPGAARTRCQLDVGPVGSVELSTWPALSAATHMESEGHEMSTSRSF